MVEDILKQLMDFIFSPLEIGLTILILISIVILVQVFILRFWKKVPGEVVKSYLKEKHGKRRKLFSPVILYSYSYGGKEYQGQSGWVMREASSNRARMQKMVDENPPGKSIVVLVNPFNHGQSALPYDVKPFHWVLILLLIASGILILATINSGS